MCNKIKKILKFWNYKFFYLVASLAIEIVENVLVFRIDVFRLKYL